MKRILLLLVVIVGMLFMGALAMSIVTDIITNMGQTLAPCNPICFPGSYDTTNPDCPCNQPDDFADPM